MEPTVDVKALREAINKALKTMPHACQIWFTDEPELHREFTKLPEVTEPFPQDETLFFYGHYGVIKWRSREERDLPVWVERAPYHTRRGVWIESADGKHRRVEV